MVLYYTLSGLNVVTGKRDGVHRKIGYFGANTKGTGLASAVEYSVRESDA
ncbi:hypothetical protein MH117_02305 [Paenibacillus sp. ACRRX]|nr:MULTISPECIES: hypothetical protein [unclassified Paenibacillus]MCG7406232.1 hypothetical protein [Paenibacillus sp. ACRRX]MDK8179265.1 hypothetical protein [Paenibacillus sp. UMB4589-SE434]